MSLFITIFVVAVAIFYSGSFIITWSIEEGKKKEEIEKLRKDAKKKILISKDSTLCINDFMH